MPLSSDQQVITFSQTYGRPLADELERTLLKCQAFLDVWTAGGISALITADGAGDTINDGSAMDGRLQITGTQLVNRRAGVLQVRDALGVTAVSGVGATVKTICDGIQVSGLPR
jgi:hypothetical protein